MSKGEFLMKRFLILLALAAFLAVPAVSMAEVVTGAGVVPSMKLQVSSVHGNPSVMTLQNFAYTKGALFFNVSSVNSEGDDGKIQHFHATVTFAGGAASSFTVNGQTKTNTISNISMDLGGLVISADNKPSAATGSGSVNGTLNITDGTTDDSDNLIVQNMSFKGSYKMNVALGGFDANHDPTTGTATFAIIISQVGPMGLAPTPNFNNSTTILTDQISPQPGVVNIAFGVTPFRVGSAGGDIPPSAGTASVGGTWYGVHMSNDLSDGGLMTISLVQNGNSLTGWLNGGDSGTSPLTGSVTGKTVALQFTDGGGYVSTITGALNTKDGTLAGTYKSTSGESGKWGAALSGSTPVGITGTWSVIADSSQGPQSVTFNLYQFGSMILGDMINPDDVTEGVSGSISGQNFSLTGKDYSSTPVHTTKITGTVSGATEDGTSASGHYSNSDGTSGTWTATKGEPVTGNSTWNLSFSMTSGVDGGNSGTATLSLTQTGSSLTGTIAPGDGSGPYSISGTVDGGGNVSLQFVGNGQDDNPETLTITGSVTSGAFGTSGAEMSGSVTSSNGSAGNWSATEQ
jgi:hypothetical protein